MHSVHKQCIASRVRRASQGSRTIMQVIAYVNPMQLFDQSCCKFWTIPQPEIQHIINSCSAQLDKPEDWHKKLQATETRPKIFWGGVAHQPLDLRVNWELGSHRSHFTPLAFFKTRCSEQNKGNFEKREEVSHLQLLLCAQNRNFHHLDKWHNKTSKIASLGVSTCHWPPCQSILLPASQTQQAAPENFLKSQYYFYKGLKLLYGKSSEMPRNNIFGDMKNLWSPTIRPTISHSTWKWLVSSKLFQCSKYFKSKMIHCIWTILKSYT